MAWLSKSKADDFSYTLNSHDFIPVVCHYDPNTLITKNGELIQIIQIHGIYSQIVRDDLVNLRNIIREAIRKNINSDAFAFWIHTIRRKENLDDPSPYPDLFSANLHNIWRDKNYWDDKFVNTLYISIVYHKPNLNISSVQAFMNSLSTGVLEKFHEDYFATAATKLCNAVDNILQDLDFFGVRRLGIRTEGDESFSELVFLFRRIINLNETPMPIPIADLSLSLATHDYVVGNNQIQVKDHSGLLFASILSLKEYHEMSSDAIELLLNLPMEFVATEVFHFVPKTKAIEKIAHTKYILETSRSNEILQERGINAMFDADDAVMNFCNQQINVMILDVDKDVLTSNVARASNELSKRGIVHVQEDINLEQTFWSQLPANFSFLRRLEPTIVDNVAALASLYNFPTGNSRGPWGPAITLFRTEQGTPHFMNLHDNRGIGHTGIFSPGGGGKTVLLNFLIAQMMKFVPTLVYINNNNRSKIFLDAIDGNYKEYKAKKLEIESNQNTVFNIENQDDIYDVMMNVGNVLSTMPGNEPKVLVVDNLSPVIPHPDFMSKFPALLESLTANNAILLFSIDLNEYSEVKFDALQQLWDEALGCEIVLAHENTEIDLADVLNLTDAENQKIKDFHALSRLFLMKQSDHSMVLEFSIGGFPALVRMLSCSDKDIEIYQQIRAQEREVEADWIVDLYNFFRSNARYG
jgi:type IV secretion/conjugal transfer VirB4 family ATPase